MSSTAKIAKLFAKSHLQVSLSATGKDMPAAHVLYDVQATLILQTMTEGFGMNDLPRIETVHTEIETALGNLQARDANRVLFTERLKALDEATAKGGELERTKRLKETFTIVDKDVPKVFDEFAKQKTRGKIPEVIDQISQDAKKRIEDKKRLLSKITTDRKPIEIQLTRTKQEYDTLNVLVSPKQLRSHEKGQAERKVSAPGSGLN